MIFPGASTRLSGPGYSSRFPQPTKIKPTTKFKQMKNVNSSPAWNAVTRNFERISDAREIGRVQIIRSVPARVSPATCEPALMDTKMGSNNVKEKNRE